MDTSSIPRYNNVFTGITKTLRILELFLLLFLLSWFLTHLRPSADYLRRLSSFLGSPLFVFAISNAIIAALVAQSSRLSTTTTNCSNSSLPPRVPEDRIMNRSESDTCNNNNKGEEDSCAAVTDSNSRKVCYRRSQSERNGEGGKRTGRRRKLRRSETTVKYPEDKLSNEEFQRTIEEFIAKQMRFLREESVEIFVQEPPTNNYNSTSLVLTTTTTTNNPSNNTQTLK